MLRALKKDPQTASIAVVALTGLSHKNAERLRRDGAVAFLEKSDLALDKGSEALLTALAEIEREAEAGGSGSTGRKRSESWFLNAQPAPHSLTPCSL